MYNEANNSYIVTLSLCAQGNPPFNKENRLLFRDLLKQSCLQPFVRLTFLTQLMFKNHDRGLNNLVYL